MSKWLEPKMPDWSQIEENLVCFNFGPIWHLYLKPFRIKQFNQELQQSKSCSKSSSTKCSFHFKLMFWLKYLIQTLVILTQKTNAHFLKQNGIVFLHLICHETPCNSKPMIGQCNIGSKSYQDICKWKGKTTLLLRQLPEQLPEHCR